MPLVSAETTEESSSRRDPLLEGRTAEHDGPTHGKAVTLLSITDNLLNTARKSGICGRSTASIVRVMSHFARLREDLSCSLLI